MVAPRVLLTETSRLPYIALLALDLAEAGIDVSAVCPSRHPMLKTRVVRQTFPYSGSRPLESLLAAIESSNPEIIIPCDDRAVRHLHELHARAFRLGALGERLTALIEKSIGPSESYPIVRARYDLLRIAREEGIRVPVTERITTAADFKSWGARERFPWVVKADGTFGGHGVRIASNHEQAEEALRELTRFYSAGRAIKRLCVNRDAFWLRPWLHGGKPSINIQSYINGRPANCAVVCWKGKVLAGVGVEVVCPVRSTSPASVVRVVENPDMMIAAERIAGRLGLSGFFGLDFMLEEGSGLTYLIEMNPRPTRVSRLQLGKGRDQVGALCAQLLNQPIRETRPVTQKQMIAYFPDAWYFKSEFLESSFHDMPEGEPELVQEMFRPWPTNSFLWRLADEAARVKTFWRGSKSNHHQGNGSVPDNA